MEIVFLIGIFLIAAIAWGFVKTVSDGKTKSSIEKRLAEVLPGAKIFASNYDQSYVALDFEHRRIVLGLNKPRGLLQREEPYRIKYDFSEIVEVEILKDGNTVSSTNRGSQAFGAALGAAAFGGVGAIIGGVSGSTTSKERIRRLTLRITVEDENHPVHDITVFFWDASKKGLRADNALLQPFLKQADTFAAHVVNAMRKTNAQPRAALPEPRQAGSVSQTLRELWTLKQEGALTEEEFRAEKTRLLGQAAPNSA